MKSVLAGLLVVMVGVFTAGVIALSAAAVFIGRRLRGTQTPAEPASPGPAATPVGRMASGGPVIDVEATEVPSVTGR